VALAAAAITTTAAVAATAVVPSAAEITRTHTSELDAAGAPAVSQADVQLAAAVGFYQVGPTAQVLNLIGLGNPGDALTSLVSLLGNPALTASLATVIDILQRVSVVEAGTAGIGPAGVYNSVTGLEFSGDYLARILNVPTTSPIYQAIVNAIGPVGQQRRAFLTALGLGGTNTAIALNDMIAAIERDDPEFGGSNGQGVTGVIAFLIRNPSRPGGGFFALFSPLTEPFGTSLSNPDLSGPNKGSFISPSKTKILNISLTDVAFKYDLMSDAPSTIYNPVSWANSLVGFVLPTYLIPKEENIGSAIGSVLPGSFAAFGNAVLVTADPTGGQGLRVIPVIGPILQALGAEGLLDATRFPGQATYITYDSGNLPLLEPFTVVQRLLGYAPGVNVPSPLADALSPALQQIVDVGYQDVNLTYKNGIPTFTRGMDMAATQAVAVNSPISSVQGLQLPQAVFNALARGITAELTPDGVGLQLLGLSLQPFLLGNPLSVALSTAIKTALTVVQAIANPVFDASEQLLTPVAQAVDLVLPKTPSAVPLPAAAARSAQAPTASALASPIRDDNAVSTATVEPSNDVANAAVSETPDLVSLAAQVNPVTVVEAALPDLSTAQVRKPVRAVERAATEAVEQAVTPVREAAEDVAESASTVVQDVTESVKSRPKLGRGPVRDAVDSVRSALKERR
jgi:hypothetical protein